MYFVLSLFRQRCERDVGRMPMMVRDSVELETPWMRGRHRAAMDDAWWSLGWKRARQGRRGFVVQVLIGKHGYDFKDEAYEEASIPLYSSSPVDSGRNGMKEDREGMGGRTYYRQEHTGGLSRGALSWGCILVIWNIPGHPRNPATVPTEALLLLISTTQSLRVNALYEMLQRSQENAGITANLLSMEQ